MDAQNVSHPTIQTALHRDEATGHYLFGVILHGEFIPLLAHKLGRIDKWAQAGKDRQASQPAAEQPAPEQQQPQQ